MPEANGKYDWLLYVASFVFPFFGLAYGMLEICRSEPVAQRRGKTFIILGVVSAGLVCAGAVAYMVAGVKAGLDVLSP